MIVKKLLKSYFESTKNIIRNVGKKNKKMYY